MDPRAVCDRLAALLRADPALERTFGACEHGFVLAPPLARVDVEAFERIHDVALPREYREFLLRVGSFGAGPGYGLTALPTEPSSTEDIAAHCPLTKAQADEVRARRAAGDDDAFVAGLVPGDGVHGLCDLGCGWNSYLVVSGPQRGTVWTGGELGWFPEAGDFDEWYGMWLGDSLTA